MSWPGFLKPTILLGLISLAVGSCIQADPRQTATGADRRFDDAPVVVTECQGFNNCATWTFAKNSKNKKIGLGKWPTGEEAVLELESTGNNQVVVIRTDLTGAKAGLTATYIGILKDYGVGGSYTSFYKGQREDGDWYWMTNQNAGSLRITECEGRNCAAFPPDAPVWTFNGSAGIGIFGTGNQPMVLEHFDANTIEVRRTDTTGPWRGSAVYTGRVQGSQISGEVRYFDPGRSAPRIGTWTGVIGTAPLPTGGSQAQTPSLTWQQFIQGMNAAHQAMEIWHWLFANE
jgi:hypothetical protein